jgi:hypothetical protein
MHSRFSIPRHLCQCAIVAATLLLGACGGTIGGLTGSANSLYLAWAAHPDPTISGYLVYFGPTQDSATQVVSDLSVASNEINPQAPSVSYHIFNDLRLRTGDTACFKLAAYNQDGISDATIGSCVTI